MQRSDIVQLISDSLNRVLSAENLVLAHPVEESTPLVGGSVLDSLGLVELVVEVEQRLRRDHGADVTLADERAMSQRRSPFRTVGTLADYVGELIGER